MPSAKDATPLYASFSEERRQVLSFIVTYLQSRNELLDEYYSKLAALNQSFSKEMNNLSSSIKKAKAIATKSKYGPVSSPSVSERSFYELACQILMEHMSAEDLSRQNSLSVNLKDVFRNLAVNQQVEIEAIDATIASLSNQQHTMCSKAEKLHAEYASAFKALSTSFEELKKRALSKQPKTGAIQLSKPGLYEKALLDFSKKARQCKNIANLFKAEADRIQPTYEEIESKKEQLKQMERANETISILKKSLMSSAEMTLFEDLDRKALQSLTPYLKGLYDSTQFFSLACSLQSASETNTINDIDLPVVTSMYPESKSLLKEINELLGDEYSTIISADGQKILKSMLSQLSEVVGTVVDKTEYEKLRISSYRSKSQPTSPTSTSSMMQYSPITTPQDSMTSSLLLPAKKKYIALYSSTAESSGELSFSQDDEFEAEDTNVEDEDWIYVLHIPTGLKGYVPRTYIKPLFE